MPDFAELTARSIEALAEEVASLSRRPRASGRGPVHFGRQHVDAWRRLFTAATGWTCREIAKLTGVHRDTVERTKRRIERADLVGGGDDLPRRGR